MKVEVVLTETDIAYDGPAKKAGIAPDARIIAVDNRQFNTTILREAVARTSKDAKGIDLLIKSGEYYSVHHVDYQGGEMYPHLVRDEGKSDLLSEIARPLAAK